VAGLGAAGFGKAGDRHSVKPVSIKLEVGD